MSLILQIKAQPKSNTQKIILMNNGTIKIYIKSAPENNKANTEIITFLAKTLSLPQQSIRIVSGHTSQLKKIVFDLINFHEELLQKLGLENQTILLKE